ncbi:DNA mismatch repair endonuclease MutL [Agriterribacter sp.]|uniref:DNA mismatch repair endonuclease MutL n=1 Tax=Agriterribacter sp. TaxID=2821509 RepID=UPI002C354376|nr:DNA mismatch repair endonuclease MutL [Agriterribacter sp.]HRO45608.1 DNA mismatch repair endonuclease MutL [Agriterribacter sp.]HRQ18667.1 DNA mismatch repair endonuclease MutL [Agriterribacter sp.]
MSDSIQLLPDNIANQIAAGEVIQRPSSAVKELLENAVDAGATEIQLIVADAGKSLVQVIDNGSGMSETDARMSFERHATSKINNIDDLFRIRTMGFRGEALASIAAVAQVELKSRRAEDETGTYIEIENSLVKKQEPVAFPVGTSIAMKNVFFNVPARRNFLKSNAVEMRHIVDEFTRVAMAFPEISFSLTANGQEIYHLESGSLKQRIVHLLGSNYTAKLVNVQEITDYLNVYGFAGKPDIAKKTRGDQYFFVNNRFIRSAYLNHAVMSAYQQMIPADSFPMYVLFIDLDPAQIDINVHPTKQEIKFEDEKIIYAFVQAAVKHALAQFSIMPTLNFDLDPGIQQLDAVARPFTEEKKEHAAASALYNTFTQKNQAHLIESKSGLKHWKDFFPEAGKTVVPGQDAVAVKFEYEQAGAIAHAAGTGQPLQLLENTDLLQVHATYIAASTNQGFILIHQQAAHERILYERYVTAAKGKPIATQHSLFPLTVPLTTADAVLLQDLLPDLHVLGYEIELFGKDTFVVQGTPADVEQGNEKVAIEQMLEQYKHFNSDVKFSKREKLIRSIAWQHAVKPGRYLAQKEMKALAEELFACDQPNITASGNPTYIAFKNDYLERMFGR